MQTKSGKSLNPIGIGTWMIGGSFTADPNAKYKGAVPAPGNEEAEIEAIRYSVSNGQNHVDCAELYGGFYTDEVVGRALADSTREDLYIADKLWRTSVANGAVRPAVEQMLAKLKTGYLDMLYIHAPFDDAPWTEAIPQIDELIDEGVVRHFGVSNFTIKDTKQAMELSKYPLSANQMNYNVLYKDEVDQDFKSFCAKNDIAIVAYQPVKRQEVLANDTIKRIAEAHDATAAQVALAWLIAQQTLPIPKAVNKDHIDENVAAANIILTSEEITALDKL